MYRRLVSIWVWLSSALVTLVWLPWLALVWLATAPFDPGRYAVGRWFRRAAVAAWPILAGTAVAVAAAAVVGAVAAALPG